MCIYRVTVEVFYSASIIHTIALGPHEDSAAHEVLICVDFTNPASSWPVRSSALGLDTSQLVRHGLLSHRFQKFPLHLSSPGVEYSIIDELL